MAEQTPIERADDALRAAGAGLNSTYAEDAVTVFESIDVEVLAVALLAADAQNAGVPVGHPDVHDERALLWGRALAQAVKAHLIGGAS